jgi:ribosomal protein S18 acetylase RimI-like enzyme
MAIVREPKLAACPSDERGFQTISPPRASSTLTDQSPRANLSSASPILANARAGTQLVSHGRLPLLLLLRLDRVQQLLDQHSFWAQKRRRSELIRMLLGSCSVVTIWAGDELVGIGRATSDGVFRAVLWDVVVATEFRSRGLGRALVEALLKCRPVARAERVYLMTTNGSEFYAKLGFCTQHGQHLLVRHHPRQANEQKKRTGN